MWITSKTIISVNICKWITVITQSKTENKQTNKKMLLLLSNRSRIEKCDSVWFGISSVDATLHAHLPSNIQYLPTHLTHFHLIGSVDSALNICFIYFMHKNTTIKKQEENIFEIFASSWHIICYGSMNTGIYQTLLFCNSDKRISKKNANNAKTDNRFISLIMLYIVLNDFHCFGMFTMQYKCHRSHWLSQNESKIFSFKRSLNLCFNYKMIFRVNKLRSHTVLGPMIAKNRLFFLSFRIFWFRISATPRWTETI